MMADKFAYICTDGNIWPKIYDKETVEENLNLPPAQRWKGTFYKLVPLELAEVTVTATQIKVI